MATAKTIPTILEIDGITGEQVMREMTTDELAQYEIDKAASIAAQAEREAKAAARQSALAKLAELGLTADEIAAL